MAQRPNAVRMNDVVIVLPGITGSVLERRREVVWGPTLGAAFRALRTRGGSIRSMRLDSPDADDGIVATRLMPDVHLVPGLVKIDGYNGLLDELRRHFRVIEGSIDDDRPANLIPFPYDWRRDLRVVAGELAGFVEQRVARWREHTGNPSAKAILIGHSMGGLVARYAAHVLGAAASTRLIVTLGTPHRGSPNAVGFLANGYKKMFVDLTETMRSFPSVHQLLPIYPLIDHDGETWRAVELTIGGVDANLAGDALAFHREIEVAVAATGGADGACPTVAVVGTGQPTLQSAVFGGGGLELGRALPRSIDSAFDGGDGTVPRVSAVPIELSDSLQSIYIGERHASLQNHAGVLNDLVHRLTLTQTSGLGEIRGTGDGRAERAVIGLDIDDAYAAGEPVLVKASMVEAGMVEATPASAAAPPADQFELTATVVAATDDPSTAGTSTPVRRPMHRVGDTLFQVELDPDLPAGTYRITVEATGAGAPTPVHDLFLVAD